MAELFDASGLAGQGGAGIPDIGGAVSEITSAFKNSAEQLTGAADELGQAAHALEKVGKAVGGGPGGKGLGNTVGGGNLGLGNKVGPGGLPVAERIVGASGRPVAMPAKDTRSGVQTLADNVNPIMSALAPVGAAMSALATATVAVVGTFVAAAAAVGAFVFLAREFVQVFDPSMVAVFDAALKDLSAVFGSVLTPVIAEASRIVKAFSGALYFVADTVLANMRTIWKTAGDALMVFIPVVGAVAQAFAGIQTAAVELYKIFAEFVMPILRGLAVALVGVVKAVEVVVTSLVKGLAGVFGKNVGNLGQALGKLVVIVTALVLSFLGFQSALDAMVTSLQPGAGQRDAGGLAAGQNSRFIGVNDLGREAMQRAFVTSGRAEVGGGQDVSDQDFRKGVLEALNAVKGGSGRAQLIDIIAAGVRAALGFDSQKESLAKVGLEATAPGNPKSAMVRAGRVLAEIFS